MKPRSAYVVAGILAVLAITAAAHALDWKVAPVEMAASVGEFASLALAPDGQPRISYRGDQGLSYAQFNGTTWKLALDEADLPRIAHGYSEIGLRYSVCDGTSWSTTTVDPDGTDDISLALLPDGRPCIAYKSKGSSLRYGAWTGTAWSIQILDSPISDPSLALDSLGRPHIAYYLDGTSDLRYAHWDGNQWKFATLDSLGTTGWQPSLALGPDGFPHIAYVDASEPAPVHALRYATFDGSCWITDTVEATGVEGWGTSIAVDAGGNVHIAFAKIGGGLYYAHGIPEPTTVALLALGLGAVFAARRRR